MRNFLQLVFISFFFIIVVINSNTAYALSVTNASITLDCTQYCINAGTTLIWNRDNTGQNKELNGFVIKDGLGDVIATAGGENPIPGSYTWPSNTCSSYTFSPKANPITFVFISNAGNGLSEQVAYQTSDICPGLPLCACYKIAYTDLDNPADSGFQYTEICLDYENHTGTWDICDLSLFPGLITQGLIYGSPCCPAYFKFHGNDNNVITGEWSCPDRNTFWGHIVDFSNCH